MIELTQDTLRFSFPEVHADATLSLDFQRTLRIPDDDRDYPLPPGLGRFPIAHVDDHAARLPAEWSRRGGVFMPMYQAEALWIHFGAGRSQYPFAVKIAAGKVNAVTGAAWSNGLHTDPQDYLSVPTQPWLDGFCVAKGVVRQFVAMPLGKGFSAEEQLTGEARFGGLQVIAYPMKAERYEALRARKIDDIPCAMMVCERRADYDMGLAPGGRMRQEIHEDPHGLDAWDTAHASRCFVGLLNSAQWASVTGKLPPSKPITAKDYAKAGLPWFEHYAEHAAPLPGAKVLAGMKSVAQKFAEQGADLFDNEPVVPGRVVRTGPGAHAVREGEF
jgi:hypothetical protein